MARRILPDGRKVTEVALRGSTDGKPRCIFLRTARASLPLAKLIAEVGETVEQVSVTGELLYADARKARKDEVRLVDASGQTHRISVPDGLMVEVVRPYWDSTVTITGVRRGNMIELHGIDEASGIESDQT